MKYRPRIQEPIQGVPTMKGHPPPEDAIEVRDAPSLPGLAFRHYRGAEDLQGMSDVFNGSREVDGWGFFNTPESLGTDLETLSNADPRDCVLLAVVDGRVVGYSPLEWVLESSGEYSFRHRVRLLPEHRGHGVRGAMLRHQEGRARAIATGLPPGSPKTLSIFVCVDETSLRDLLEAEGYSVSRYYYEMLRPLDEPIPDLPLPQGLSVRPPGDEEEYRRVFQAEVEASRGTYGFFEPEDNIYTRIREDPNFTPDMWVVAWEGVRPVGAVRNWIDEVENKESGRLWGYTEDIFVSRDHRRRGLARALIARSLRMLADRGMEQANLGVDTQNATGALDLYTGMGYQVYKTYMVYRKPL